MGPRWTGSCWRSPLICGCSGRRRAARRIDSSAVARTKNPRVEPKPYGGTAPHVGLTAFRPSDSNRFHGRDRLDPKLVGQVDERRFVGVFGTSGRDADLVEAPRPSQVLVGPDQLERMFE